MTSKYEFDSSKWEQKLDKLHVEKDFAFYLMEVFQNAKNWSAYDVAYSEYNKKWDEINATYKEWSMAIDKWHDENK